MRKIYLFFLIGIIGIIFILYNSLDLSLNTEITPRKVLKSPIEGEWVLDKSIFFGDKNLDSTNQSKYFNKPLSFSSKAVIFNNMVCYSPIYKVKLVNTYDYFWNNFKVNPKTIGLKTDKVEVITISSKDKYYDEYIKISENSIVKQEEDMLLFFKKTDASSVDSNEKTENLIDYKNIASVSDKEAKSKSGLLLALMDYQGNYRTLWISSINKTFMPVTEVKDILLPRMNGFWKLGSDNDLWAFPMKSDMSKEKYNNIRNNKAKINFVGNDYISIETSDKKLEVLPIDNLNSAPIRLSTALGQDFSSSILQMQNDNREANNINELNWGVFRRGGRWIIRGRTNNDVRANYKDVDISYATPKSILKYDDLYPSFSETKTKVPEALDMFSSVNRDFDVIVTKDQLLIIPIIDGKLGNIVNKIALKKGEIPVMSHWATGNYVDEWAKKVK